MADWRDEMRVKFERSNRTVRQRGQSDADFAAQSIRKAKEIARAVDARCDEYPGCGDACECRREREAIQAESD